MVSFEFLRRVNSYPLVGDTAANACYYYNLAKNGNTLLSKSCHLTECGMNLLTSCSKPIISQCDQQITAIDFALCKVLNYIESTYPHIKEPSDVVLGDGKRVLQPHLDTILMPYNVAKVSVATCCEMLNKTMDAGRKRVGHLQENGRDVTKNILDKLDACVEHYLPEDIEMKPVEEFTVGERPSSDNLQQHACAILSSVQQRLYSRYRRKNFYIRIDMDYIKRRIIDNYYVQALLKAEEGLSQEFWQKLEEFRNNSDDMAGKSTHGFATIYEKLMIGDQAAALMVAPLLRNTNNVVKVLLAMFCERLSEQQQQMLCNQVQYLQSMIPYSKPVQTKSDQEINQPVAQNVNDTLDGNDCNQPLDHGSTDD